MAFEISVHGRGYGFDSQGSTLGKNGVFNTAVFSGWHRTDQK